MWHNRLHSFSFVLAPVRESFGLFWRETHKKGQRVRSPAGPELKAGRKVSEKTERVNWQRKAEENSRLQIAVQRRRQWEDGSRAEKRVNRNQKGDYKDLLTYRGWVNQREKMLALLIASENFVREHVQISSQNTVSQTSYFLRLELTQVRVCSFVLFLHPLGCALRICKEMCNVPGRR